MSRGQAARLAAVCASQTASQVSSRSAPTDSPQAAHLATLGQLRQRLVGGSDDLALGWGWRQQAHRLGRCNAGLGSQQVYTA